MTNKTSIGLLRVAGVLWLVWGIVHALAGVMVISSDAANGFQAIADAVPAGQIASEFHPAVGAILNQHAWNLLWGGLVTMVCGVLMWRYNIVATWLAALVGGLLDIGYFMFLDLGGFVNFLPGTLMTIVSGSAILLSAGVFVATRQSSSTASSNLKDRLS